ncbi:MAG: hypothetical protein MRZ79_13480 [Bacteroidia bacterium]|nr:hypothetical protein [Bacteroidia bacterium]
MEEEYFKSKNFDYLVEELEKVAPFKIKFKDESWEMHLLNVLVFWFNPGFLTQYTTVIGKTIYFPDKNYIRYNETSAMKTLVHEMVHILDARNQGVGFFALGYLFPQILTLGVFAFPFLGWWSLLFLIFALPIPAPFRAESEARAYALDVLLAHPYDHEDILNRIANLFTSWDYYRMSNSPKWVVERIRYWMDATESGAASAKAMTTVLLIYEMVAED